MNYMSLYSERITTLFDISQISKSQKDRQRNRCVQKELTFNADHGQTLRNSFTTVIRWS